MYFLLVDLPHSQCGTITRTHNVPRCIFSTGRRCLSGMGKRKRRRSARRKMPRSARPQRRRAPSAASESTLATPTATPARKQVLAQIHRRRTRAGVAAAAAAVEVAAAAAAAAAATAAKVAAAAAAEQWQQHQHQQQRTRGERGAQRHRRRSSMRLAGAMTSSRCAATRVRRSCLRGQSSASSAVCRRRCAATRVRRSCLRGQSSAPSAVCRRRRRHCRRRFFARPPSRATRTAGPPPRAPHRPPRPTRSSDYCRAVAARPLLAHALRCTNRWWRLLAHVLPRRTPPRPSSI